MKDITQTITINRPVQRAFAYTLNPDNTPKWIDTTVQERANETPAKLGTVYRNQGQDGNWSEYEITAFQPGVMFVLSKKDGNLTVKYTFKPLGHYQCELEYYIGGDIGDLDETFIQHILQKLKAVIERDK